MPAKIETQSSSKNFHSSQIDNKGWNQIIELAGNGKASALGLYAFFAQNIDHAYCAIVCDQQFLADHFNVTTRTIRNWLKFLEKKNAILRIPVAGRVCAYVIDPYEVWKDYDTTQPYATFVTKTLVNKNDEIKRQMETRFNPRKNPAQIDLEEFEEFKDPK